jgi:CRP-like cAMP-binding protein
MNEASKQTFLELCHGAPTEHFKKGELLMRQGEAGGFCYVILSGSVAVQKLMSDGQSRQIATRFAGELVGELSLFLNIRSATLVANEVCTCARIPHAALLQIVTTQPTLALALLAATMEKVRDASV